MRNFYILFISLLMTTAGFGQVINEIDADQTSTDTEEFIEIKWTPNTSLNGYSIVLFNGSDDLSYAAYDLDGFSTDANGFFIAATTALVGSPSDLDLGADNAIQNGADAVALYLDDAVNFPNDTAITTTNLIDVVVYGTSDADDAGLLGGFGETTQWDENLNGLKDTESLQRTDDGTMYETKTPTFRAENSAATCDLTLTGNSATCDAFTAGTDTYTATVDFVGGGTSMYTITVTPMVGTVDLSAGDPDLDASGTITINGVPEGTDIVVNVSDGGLCDLDSNITSPLCEPTLDLPIIEPFDYTAGTNLIDAADWDNISASSDEVLIAAGNLTYPDLAASTGNKISFDGGGSDPGIEFTPSTGTVYASFIFQVTDLTGVLDPDGGYFALLGSFDARLWIIPTGGGSTFNVGIGYSSSVADAIDPTNYALNTPVFVVMSYEAGTGVMNAWINPAGADFEGSAPAATISATDTAPAASLNQFAFRQDSANETGFIEADELRLGSSWSEVTPTTLSTGNVEITEFKLYPNPNNIGTLTIDISNSESTTVSIYNILGKEMLSETLINKTVDVSSLSAGLYIVKLEQGNASTTKKLIIK